MMLLIFGAPVGSWRWPPARWPDAAGRRAFIGPLPAECIFSQSLPKSLFFAFGATCFSSTIEAMGWKNIQRHRRADVGGPVQRQGMVINLFSWLAMLSGCQPSTLRINAGDLFSVTRGCEKITSSGRSGLPEAWHPASV